ncbi:hypothetical protein GCM10022226_78770 [Sphaerisporangium flaviroseum]|uniref:Type II toxin-antitoxin system HicA family toxin n=1 Tax=Sphaerisporangium flaviroseum TaxID=509199 RepID=A0ABP7JGL5_9ACTN
MNRATSRGRHSKGQPRTTKAVPRRPWDLAQRAEADRVNALEPGWLVLYRLHDRHFEAIPCVEGIASPVTAPTMQALREAMRDAELFRRPGARA